MHLFNNESKATPVGNIRESIRVEDGAVYFKVNTGKGSGEQSINLADFRPVVDTLKGYVEAGITRDEITESPVDTIKRTIGQEDGMISFRLTNGKGAKPVKVSADEFAAVVSFLEKCCGQIEDLSKAHK